MVGNRYRCGCLAHSAREDKNGSIAHVVPLSRQVIDLLQAFRALKNSDNFLFLALHTSVRPMCENTLNVALRRLGYGSDEMTSHGFRAIASTLLNESGISLMFVFKSLWHDVVLSVS